MTVSCFLNPKTDDLPGSNVAGPGINLPGGGDYGNDPADEVPLAPGLDSPPDLGEVPPSAAPPDAGSEAADTLPADAGGALAFPFSHDAGLDAE